ncbi:MAG: DNA-binding protein WhiA [Oscillospiraceae bacterium]|nr:DNA-binding protein WhiA [Oscillospiraceae bacterium]
MREPSFSSAAKAELCRVTLNRDCCVAAEAYGALLFANSFSAREIRFITASLDFARRLPRLWRRAFGFEFDETRESGAGGRSVLLLRDAEKIRAVFDRFGYDPESLLSHHINLGVLEEEDCRSAFFRGAFLAGGSVTDPEKRCRLELVTDHRNVCGEARALLLEMGLSPKDTVRTGHFVLYFKQSEAIEDFFTALGAPGAAMGIMSAKITKEMRSAVNRKVNCDSANADKIVSAAQRQLDRIRTLDRTLGLANLPPELRDTALLRIANPEASLSDLAMLSDPPLSKSAINHRLRRLMALEAENGE